MQLSSHSIRIYLTRRNIVSRVTKGEAQILVFLNQLKLYVRPSWVDFKYYIYTLTLEHILRVCDIILSDI